jgi:hypothetical protein
VAAPDLVRQLQEEADDAFVTAPSAEGLLGNDEPALFPNSTVRVCPKITHIALAHRPEVYNEITKWWS